MSGRPAILFPLFAGLETLDGIGPKTAQAFARRSASNAARSALHLALFAWIDRRTASIREVRAARHGDGRGRGRSAPSAAHQGRAYRVEVQDAATTFQLVFFHARDDWLKQQLPTGQRRLVSGKVEIFDGIAQMVHPDHMLPVEEAEEIPAFEPVYPLTAGITQKADAARRRRRR